MEDFFKFCGLLRISELYLFQPIVINEKPIKMRQTRIVVIANSDSLFQNWLFYPSGEQYNMKWETIGGYITDKSLLFNYYQWRFSFLPKACSGVTGARPLFPRLEITSESFLRSLWHPHRITGALLRYCRISGIHLFLTL